MAKTFAPQMARMLQRVVIYQAKHAAKIAAVASAQQNADLAAIVAAINSSWAAVPTHEQP
jgi:galactose-1-phosphate uridylyltransferase